MMVKGRCKHSKLHLGVLVGLILFAGGCSLPVHNKSDTSVLKDSKKTQEAWKVQVVPNEVEPGSVAVVKIFPDEGPEEDPKEKKKHSFVGKFEGITLPFFPVVEGQGDGSGSEKKRHYEALLSVPYERKPGSAKLVLVETERSPGSSDTKPSFELDVPFKVKAGNYLSEVLHVDGSRVNPKKKSVLKRIMKERQEVGQLYQQVTLQRYWDGPFRLPLEQSQVTSPFGTRRVYNGRLKSYHTGVDFKAKVKTPIYATAPGKVILAKELFYTGNTVILDHGYGVLTLYAHMSKFNVKKGQMLNDHDLIGLSGKTGRVNGPHLHWMAIVHNVRVNPLALTEVLK